MKKILTAVFACMLMLSLSLSTLAAGGFVFSPSAHSAPVLVEAKNEAEDCQAVIVITAYADRADLGEAGAAAMTAAYNAIVAAGDLGTLDASLADLAKKLDIASSELAVSDLFDVSYSNCDTHEEHGDFTVTVRPTSAENACGVLHYVNGAWELLSCDVENGEITFVADSLSPFAIVVHSGLPAGSSLPLIIGISVAVVVVAAGVVVTVIFLKKKKEDSAKA